MFRPLLYLAFAIVASSAIATAMASKNPPVTCAGARTNQNAKPALRRVFAHERCIAVVNER
jgi:hypothetical protein